MDKIKILVVDDESRMRKLVRDFLIRDNFEVIEAGDGEEALDLFYQDKDISLIILSEGAISASAPNSAIRGIITNHAIIPPENI